MNQNQQNPLDDLPFGPTPETLEFTTELTTSDLKSLIVKYGRTSLFDKIFRPDTRFYSTFDNIVMREHEFVTNFWPIKEKFTLTQKAGWQIVELFANTAEEIKIRENITKINPQLVIPDNLDFATTRTDAQKINLAYSTAVSLLLDNLTGEFLLDTLNFYRMDATKLEDLRMEIDQYVGEITKQVELGNSYDFLPKELSNKITILLNQIGRAQFSANEQKNFSEVSEIFEKLEIAVQAAISMKKLNIQAGQNINDIANQEIKKALQPNFYPDEMTSVPKNA